MSDKRLSWDEYFLKIMDTVSERATCDRGKCGCLFVKDKQVLITGYVGAPPNFPHCDEIGHSFHEKINFVNATDEELIDIEVIQKYNLMGYTNINLDKKRFEMKPSIHCNHTVHSEQAAIAQATRTGVILKGSTLYVKFTPCKVCTNLLISIGIERVVCSKKYHVGGESEEMFKRAGIKLEFISNEIQQYPVEK